jgi:predicted transcriptional regulator
MTRDSISVSVLQRILIALDDHGTSINRTNLAVKTGLNYNTCLKYLNFLALAGWVTFHRETQGHVSITETGRWFTGILQAGKMPAKPVYSELVNVIGQSRPDVKRAHQ